MFHAFITAVITICCFYMLFIHIRNINGMLKNFQQEKGEKISFNKIDQCVIIGFEILCIIFMCSLLVVNWYNF